MTKKRAFNKERREFFKYSGKVATRAAGYGFIGNLLGRLYGGGKDVYEENIEPYVDGGKSKLNKLSKGIQRFIDNSRLTPKEERSLERKKESKKLSRRSFFTLPFRLFHEYPVATSTAIGTTYGGTKQALKSHERYKTQTKIDELDAKLDYLIGLHEKKEKSGLEKEITEPEALIAVGIVGVFISAVLSSLSFTGFSIAGKAVMNNNWIDAIIFGLSLILIFVGVLKRKK